MPRTPNQSIGFETLLKSFIKTLNLPTKKDIDRLTEQMTRLEKLISKTNASLNRPGKAVLPKMTAKKRGKAAARAKMTASAAVFEVIAESPLGADFKTIQSQTGFDGKKIRNIIFRLNKTEKIKRKDRGTYVAIG